VRVLHEPLEQVDARILLFEQDVPEPVGERQDPQRPHGVDEERVRTVERVDEAAVGQARPAVGLHRAADLQGKLVEVPLPRARVDAPLARQPPERAVGAHVVEAVIVHARVREVRGHAGDRRAAAAVEELGLARRVELQERGADDEAFRPLGPPARAVAAAHGEDRRAVGGVPALVDQPDRAGRPFEEPFDLRLQVGGGAGAVDANHARYDTGP
jgi:hypothetical protein